jgi:hypothetical protein
VDVISRSVPVVKAQVHGVKLKILSPDLHFDGIWEETEEQESITGSNSSSPPGTGRERVGVKREGDRYREREQKEGETEGKEI